MALRQLSIRSEMPHFEEVEGRNEYKEDHTQTEDLPTPQELIQKTREIPASLRESIRGAVSDTYDVMLRSRRFRTFLVLMAISGAVSHYTPNLTSEVEASGPDTHIVQSGNTLYGIAREHGVSYRQILEANPQIKNPNRIFVNQEIVIPGNSVNSSNSNVESDESGLSSAENPFASSENLQIYGERDPLNNREVQNLIEELNSEDIVMEGDTWYMSIFIESDVVRSFPSITGESYFSFIQRHEDVLNSWLGGFNFKIRRVVITGEDVYHPAEMLGSNELRDSNGARSIREYNPNGSSYFNGSLDYGEIHEWVHIGLELPDGYYFDFDAVNSNDVWPTRLEKIPQHLRIYQQGHRPDRVSNMSSPGQQGLNSAELVQLSRRYEDGWVHNNPRTTPEIEAQVPSEFPDQVKFYLPQHLEGTRADLFRTHIGERTDNRGWRRVPVYSTSGYVENGGVTFDVESIIQRGDSEMATRPDFTHMSESVFFLVFYDPIGNYEPYILWFDARDLNFAKWLGEDAFRAVDYKGDGKLFPQLAP